MTNCPWCTGPAWLCMHVPGNEADERARYEDWLTRTGQKLERTDDDD